MNTRVARLQQWKGIPIPFFVTMRKDNTPDFKVINEENRMRCAQEHLCWICGEELAYWIFFIGGPESVKAQMFVDGPMHLECAEDALELCPFLVGSMDYAKTFDLSKHEKDVKFTSGAARNPNQKPPDKMGLVRTRQFQIAIARDPRSPDSGCWFFNVNKVVDVEWRSR